MVSDTLVYNVFLGSKTTPTARNEINMLHKLKSASYEDIAKYFPELGGKLSSSDHKKQILLGMAKSGEEKPKQNTKLGCVLYSYLSRKSSSHDPKFTKEIKRLQPDWLLSKAEKTKHKKLLLLTMAKKGEPKPLLPPRPSARNLRLSIPKKNPLAVAFREYTRKRKIKSTRSSTYDPIFTKQIKKLRPDWFVSPSEMVNQKKKELLEMAGNGEPRPSQKTPLGCGLSGYTGEKTSSHDPIFTKQIKKLRPDWFVSPSETAKQKKKELLEMAGNGEPRPSQKTPLGSVLSGYTVKSSSSCDPIFTKQIKKLRPDWFVSKAEKTKYKKLLLLTMAKKGEPRPDRKSPLGSAMNNYTFRNPDFIKQLIKLRPDWFVSRTEKAQQKKKLLLKMARKGASRPIQKTSLGKALSCYTTNIKCLDPVFTKEIKKLAPHWFRKCSTN